MPLSPKRQRYDHDDQAQIDEQLSAAEEEEPSSSSSPLKFSFLSSLSFPSSPVPPSSPLSSSFMYPDSSPPPSISSSLSSSSCSFHFSYLSTSSAASSPLTVDTQDEVEVPAAVTASPPQTPQRSFSVPSLDTLGEDLSTSEWEAGPSTLQASTSTGYSARDPLNEKVTDLVQFLLYKYQMRQSITKAEMLNMIINKNQFPVIFHRASNCIKIVFGLDMREVDPTIHSYAFFNSLDLTYDAMPSDAQRMPKNGLLILVLGLIILKDNCVPEEEMWAFLNSLDLYDGREHFIYGEPRQLLTREWVQEMYLEYWQVPNSDPACYEFLWGPRAHAETSKEKVLEFLSMVERADPSPVSSEDEEALRDEEENAQIRIAPADSTTTVSAASPAPK